MLNGLNDPGAPLYLHSYKIFQFDRREVWVNGSKFQILGRLSSSHLAVGDCPMIPGLDPKFLIKGGKQIEKK